MTIFEVSEKYGIKPDILRYYERIGLIPPVERGKSGTRNYTELDCEWVDFIKCMRRAGFLSSRSSTMFAFYSVGI